MSRLSRAVAAFRGQTPSPERRDPTAATQPLQFMSPGLPQVPNWNPARAVKQGYLANFVVARCIQIKAGDIAALPFLTGPRLPVDYTERPETNPNCHLHRLLGVSPAPRVAAAKWWEWMLTQRYLTGAMAAEAEWGDWQGSETIAALYPIPTAHVRPVPTASGTRWFEKFEIGPPTGSRQKKLPPLRLVGEKGVSNELMYEWDAAPDDWRQAYSVLQSASIDVNVANLLGQYAQAFLMNDARPAAVVVTQPFADEEDFEAFANQFEGRHRGPANAGKVAFLEAESSDGSDVKATDMLSVQVLGLSQKDARMLEQHRASLEHVAMALGVPWSRLSAADRTFSNAGQESVDYWKSLAGDARKIAGEVNASLAPLLGSEVGWFDLSGVEALAPRPPVSAGEAAILVRDGIATSDEVRPWYGLSGPGPEMPALPAGGSDAPALPAPDVSPTTLGRPAPVPLPGGAADGGDADLRGGAVAGLPVAPTAEVAPLAGRQALDARAGSDLGEHRGLTAEEQETRRTTIWKRNNATLVGLEAAFAKRWASYFDRQAAVVVDQITAKRTATRLTAASAARELRADLGIGGPMDPNEVARWRAQALDLADLMHNAAGTAGVTRVNNAFGVSFDLEQPFLADFIAARANQLAGQVTSSTYAAIQQALQDGVANGASIDDLASAVQDVFDVASRSRAKTIARTEVISAANGSADLAAAQLPSDVVGGKEWISTRDERTRDDHAEADGQVVLMGEAFVVGGEPLAYPGDPSGDAGNVISCRCTEAFLTPAEMEARGRSRVVPLRTARALLRMVPAGTFDEAAFRSALQEAAA